MLLRSISKHVKDQNWFAVGLDFLIVVLGVVIGIQVANWNAAQADRRTSERLLLQLKEDFTKSLEYYVPLDASIHDAMLALDTQLRALEEGEPLALEVAIESANLWSYSELIPPPPASFKEMIATGRLDLIGSTAVRSALQGVQEITDLTMVINAQHNDSLGNLFRDLSPYLRFARAPRPAGVEPPTEDGALLVKAFDQTAAWADAQARSALYTVYETHSSAHRWVQANEQAINDLLEQIEQAENRP